MDIIKNIEKIRNEIKDCTKINGRNPAKIKLVAISKNKPSSNILKAYEAGQRIFGENYAQELVQKANELQNLDIEWHFTGHLQTNKIKYITPIVKMVETVCSLKMIEALSKKTEKTIDCLIEVNLGNEESKSGVAEENLRELIKQANNFQNINVRGLMILPPYSENPENSRPYFKKLKQIFDKINAEKIYREPFTELSMGMSHDYKIAVEEGATIVRIGTAIFGSR